MLDLTNDTYHIQAPQFLERRNQFLRKNTNANPNVQERRTERAEDLISGPSFYARWRQDDVSSRQTPSRNLRCVVWKSHAQAHNQRIDCSRYANQMTGSAMLLTLVSIAFTQPAAITKSRRAAVYGLGPTSCKERISRLTKC